jgi:hypothetical protein
MAHGHGKHVTTDGTISEGQWAKNQLNGKATVRQANGASYSGEWKKDKYEGRGIQKWANGSEYRGYY